MQVPLSAVKYKEEEQDTQLVFDPAEQVAQELWQSRCNVQLVIVFSYISNLFTYAFGN